MKIIRFLISCTTTALLCATMGVSVWAGELPIELPDELVGTTAALCEQYGVDYDIVVAICWHESGMDVNAINEYSGCVGLMQIHPINKDWLLNDYGLDISVPEQNIEAGILILSMFLEDYTLDEALAAYAEGESGMLQGRGGWFAKEILDIIEGA